MLKSLIKPVYHFTHDALYATSSLNPFFKKSNAGKKVLKGFIGDEHLNNPALDDALETQLASEGIEVKHHTININEYYNYLSTANYPKDYYGGGFDPKNNFTEKTLEHFVTTEIIPFKPDTIYMDVAACTSPFSDIVKNIFGVKTTYKQDLVYPRGMHENKIGGYAHETGLPDNSIDAITLHCSLEHFEGNSDELFFKEVNRILKPEGKCIILPFYFAHTYTIHIDPAFNFLRNHHPIIDKEAELRYCNWYQFHSRHYDVTRLKKRIINNLPDCNISLHRVTNFRNVDARCYLRWILEISK